MVGEFDVQNRTRVNGEITLVDLCVDVLLDSESYLLLLDASKAKPHPQIVFSPLLSLRVLEHCKSRPDIDRILPLFSQFSQTPLNGFIDLSNSSVSRISPLASQVARFVNCEYSKNLTIDHILETFRGSTSSLLYLNVEALTVVNPYLKGVESLDSSNSNEIDPAFDIDCWLGRFKNLQYLTVAYTNLSYSYLSREVLPYLNNLTHLDIGGMTVTDGLGVLKSLRDSLKSLFLYNVSPHFGSLVEQRFVTIYELKKLQVLDISFCQSDGIAISYGIENLLLKLVGSLPELSSLDISGTTLAEESVNRDLLQVYLRQRPQTVDSVIPSLQILESPLEFLGLLNSTMAVRTPLPARVVTGTSNEKQLLENFNRYKRRKPFILETFHSVYQLLRDKVIKKPVEFLHHIIDCMKLYIDAIEIQVSGSASLFHLSSDDCYKTQLSKTHKRDIIEQCLESMQKHKYHDGMQRNGCLVMFNFEIPDNFEFVYDELVLQTLHTIENMSTNVSRIAIHLLNAMMGHADRKYKLRAQRLNVIQVLVDAIFKRVGNQRHDELIEHAWSSLWNLTDETEINCEIFIQMDGIRMFLKCHDLFKQHQELIRNMLGCLGNVAEVQKLRKFMLTHDCLRVFSELLRPGIDEDGESLLIHADLEISYNACGILAHLLSDGEAVWNVPEPSRAQIKERMVTAILTWNPRGERNINYRSFLPILRLLQPEKCFAMEPESQFWAVWALFNLCTVYPDKYIEMLLSENGLSILQSVTNNAEQDSQLHRHCVMLLEILQSYGM